MDEAEAKRRLLLYSLVRAAGLAIFLLGVAIIYTDIVRPGGAPQLGAVIAIIGVLDALLTPPALKRTWDRRDDQS